MSVTLSPKFRSSPSRGLLLLAALVASTALAADPSSAPKKSPFMSAGTTTAATVTANETIEFAGVSSIGTRTDLIFFDKTAKKSRWVGLGDTVEGISAVSYDPRKEEAVVYINGTQKTLPLRKPGRTIPSPSAPPVAMLRPAPEFVPTQAQPAVVMPLPSNAAAPVQATTPAAPATAEQIAKQESEARMLVSDLLEIGMAQRKAYEEAHRKAQQEGQQPPSALPTPSANGQAR